MNHFDDSRKKVMEGLDTVLLSWKVEFDLRVPNRKPICLPDFNTLPKNCQTCWLAGFGKTETGSPPTTLKQYPMKYYPLPKCAKFFKFAISEFLRSHENTTCFNTDNEKSSTQCSGDSGGPAMCEVNGRYVLFGVVSMRITKCGDSSAPASFGGVSRFLPFMCCKMRVSERPVVCEGLCGIDRKSVV